MQLPPSPSDYWQLDAGFGYQLTDKIAVVFEAINLTDENLDQYNIVGPVSRREQLFYISNSGRRMQAGVRVRLLVPSRLEFTLGRRACPVPSRIHARYRVPSRLNSRSVSEGLSRPVSNSRSVSEGCPVPSRIHARYRRACPVPSRIHARYRRACPVPSRIHARYRRAVPSRCEFVHAAETGGHKGRPYTRVHGPSHHINRA